MTNEYGRVPDGTGLSQAELASGLGPSGFDPSRDVLFPLAPRPCPTCRDDDWRTYCEDCMNTGLDSDDVRAIEAEAIAFDKGVETMLLYEESGGDGWWRGWDQLKAAYHRARIHRDSAGPKDIAKAGASA